MFSRMREGWEPVRADEYGPKRKYPVVEEGKNKGIGVGGLMLARIPQKQSKEN